MWKKINVRVKVTPEHNNFWRGEANHLRGTPDTNNRKEGGSVRLNSWKDEIKWHTGHKIVCRGQVKELTGHTDTNVNGKCGK